MEKEGKYKELLNNIKSILEFSSPREDKPENNAWNLGFYRTTVELAKKEIDKYDKQYKLL